MPNTHLEALQRKHHVLEAKIHEELTHPASDDLKIRRLKEEKLHLKEEISRLQKASG